MSIVRTVSAAGLLMTVALGAALVSAPAHADDVSVLFLRELRQHGVVYGDDNATADAGIGVCKQFDSGQSYADVQSILRRLPAASSFKPDDISIVIAAAVHQMCPQFTDKLPH